MAEKKTSEQDEPTADADVEAAETDAEPEAEEPAAEVAAEAAEPEAEEAAEEPAPVEDAPEPEPELEVAAEAEEVEDGAETDAEPEAETADEGTEAEAAAPAPQSGPKPKKKRLPRSQRPQRSKKAPVKPATRKPIVRLEKPEHDRGRRQERQGTVVSNAMDKTIVVKVDVLKAHPKYKKVVRRSTTFHAHDESNQANVGDVVRIVETRPVSKTKRWRLAEVVEAAR